MADVRIAASLEAVGQLPVWSGQAGEAWRNKHQTLVTFTLSSSGSLRRGDGFHQRDGVEVPQGPGRVCESLFVGL